MTQSEHPEDGPATPGEPAQHDAPAASEPATQRLNRSPEDTLPTPPYGTPVTPAGPPAYPSQPGAEPGNVPPDYDPQSYAPPGRAAPYVAPESRQTGYLPAVPTSALPPAASRVAINIVGGIVGCIVAAGAWWLLARGMGHIIGATGVRVDWSSVGSAGVGAALFAIIALMAAWASWAPITPGIVLTAASLWSMVTLDKPNGGARRIADVLPRRFDPDDVAALLATGTGLAVGLMLVASGAAAVIVRAAVRHRIRRELDTQRL